MRNDFIQCADPVSDMRNKLLSAVVFGFMAVSQSAFAGQVLSVEVDKSHILTLPSTPGAIVIGNPAIADVSIQGQKIFIHGRSFGQTNLTILDLEGNQIANFDLIGKHTQVSTVAVFRGPLRQSYSCSTLCESQIQVGDDPAYFDFLRKETEDKFKLATGSKSAEAEAPAAPQ